MNKPEFNHDLGAYFNHNIEMLRDIAQTIGTDKMVNAYENLSFGINSSNHVVVMIRGRSDIDQTPKYVCVEYEGDGMCHIEPTDCNGNPIDDTRNIDKLFDTHSDRLPTIQEAFRSRLRDKFLIRF